MAMRHRTPRTAAQRQSAQAFAREITHDVFTEARQRPLSDADIEELRRASTPRPLTAPRKLK